MAKENSKIEMNTFVKFFTCAEGGQTLILVNYIDDSLFNRISSLKSGFLSRSGSPSKYPIDKSNNKQN